MSSDFSDLSEYDKIHRFLQYIVENMKDQLENQSLNINGDEIGLKLGLNQSDVEEILKIIGDFYSFFKFFFNKKEEKKTKSGEYGSSAFKNKIGENYNNKFEFSVNKDLIWALSDYSYFYGEKAIPLIEFKKKFSDLEILRKKIPILFETDKNVKVSRIGIQICNKIRQFKILGKKISKLQIENFYFILK
ncbi:MAG: hypothetical protein GY870_06190 [archaeon]|nr:hypothetical protein [archaeon]